MKDNKKKKKIFQKREPEGSAVKTVLIHTCL